jgi:DNA-binding NarL/FixJ family response regulator
MTPIRVLLCDDAADWRALVRFQLEDDAEIEVVGEAGDGRAAIDEAAQTQPDVVLLDVQMPVCDGLEALPHMRAAAPGAHVLVLSGTDRSAAALERGAEAFLPKSTPADGIRAAIHAAAAGRLAA